MAQTALETLLLGSAPPAAPRPRCRVVVGNSPLQFDLARLQDALHRSAAGDVVAYAVPLAAPAAVRLLLLATLALRLRCAEWMMQRSGARAAVRYGIEPHLEAPAFVFELNTAASQYADRFLRARAPAAALRRLAARWFGCDPAIGAVVVMARKS